MDNNIYEVRVVVQRPCPEASAEACDSIDHQSKLSGGEAVHRFFRSGFITGTHLRNALETSCDANHETLVDVLESKKIGTIGI